MDVVGQEDDLLETVDRRQQAQSLLRAVKECLTPQEQQVICMRYGLNGDVPMRQREVATVTGISRSYVSRIEKKALEKLKQVLEE